MIKARLEGSFVYENLLAANAGAPWLGSTEVYLYSDSGIVGDFGSAPYEFLNTVTSIWDKVVRPGAVLRTSFHWSHTLPSPSDRKTDATRYHKGWIDDEVAAIASLVLGTRLHAGPTIREFRPGYPQVGSPTYNLRSAVPDLPHAGGYRVFPSPDRVLLPDLGMLSDLALLTPLQSVALTKAARLYQQSLWMAEVDAANAWLILVSAVETVATCWKSTAKSAIDELREGSPQIFSYLDSFGDSALLSGMAELLKGQHRVSVKFVDFLTRFCPEALSLRPPPGFQIPWEESSLRTAFKKIYDHRSRALHDGIPFPFPMTEAPQSWDGPSGAMTERSGGLSTSTLGATWDREDYPMLLHIFAHIARGAIKNWWVSACR